MTAPGLETACWNSDLLAAVRRAAVLEGFELTGVAAAPSADASDGQQTAERFTTWVDEGRAGEMDYLKRCDEVGELLRRSARVALPWVRSVVVCAFNYNADGPYSTAPAPPETGWIARYAWMGTATGAPADYHDVLLARLRVVEAELLAQVDCQTRCYVDTGPLLERDFATRAGVGWIGKNTCVLNQQQGSWLLLAVIVTSLELPPVVASLPAADRCGSCTRCLDACPTGALIAPRQMDAALCIAYLTIEKKGEIAPELRAPMGRQVFGCDICQDVCPWNRQAPVSLRPDLAPRRELVNPPLAQMAALDDAEFRRLFKGSPLERTKRRRVQRNVAIAMGNSGQADFAPALEAWARGDDPVLAEAADWALKRIAGAAALSPVPFQKEASDEQHQAARDEVQGVNKDVDVLKARPSPAPGSGR